MRYPVGIGLFVKEIGMFLKYFESQKSSAIGLYSLNYFIVHQ